jgi:hypothetical protein
VAACRCRNLLAPYFPGRLAGCQSLKLKCFGLAGTKVSFKLADKSPFISRQVLLANAESHMLMLSDDSTSPGAAATKIYFGDVETEQVVRTLDFTKDG